MPRLASPPNLFVVTALVVLCGCGGAPANEATGSAPVTDDAAAFPLTVDNCGEQVTFPAAPEAILTIGTSAVWNIYAAGGGDRIVARSGEFGAPLGSEELTSFFADTPVVDPSDPTAEAITATGADLVIGYGLFNTTDEALADLGVENLENLGDCGHDGVQQPPPVTAETMLADIERLGQVLGTADAATQTVETLRAELTEWEERRPVETADAAILYHFAGELGTHGGRNFSADILQRAGLLNVFADQDDLYLNPSRESIIDSDPDYIVVHYGVEGESFEQALDALLAEPGIADLRAIVEGSIIGLPYDALTSTPGALDGVRLLIEGRAELEQAN